MPRVQFSDVVPPEKRSIRNIPIPNSARRTKAPTEEDSSFNPVPIERKTESRANGPIIVEDTAPQKSAFKSGFPSSSTPATNFSKNRTENYYHEDSFPQNKKGKKWLFGGLTIFAIVVFVFVMMTIFSSAKVSVTAKSQPINISMKIEAGPEMSGVSRVPYEIIKVSKTKSVSVEATEEEMLERKASGKITIYNNFSNDPQRLIIRTRFESPEGLIYRIPESVVVPGKTASGPGTIEVEVFADEPGEKYNIGKADFTIPGFKNDSARYKTFYAKSSVGMAGGFVGRVKKIDKATRENTLKTIDAELQAEIQKELSLQTPANLVMLQNSIFFESKELPQKDSGDTATLTKEATGYALMLNKDKLSKVITEKYLSTSSPTSSAWQNIESTIEDFSSVKTAGLNSTPNGEAMSLELQGDAIAKAKVDINLLSESLAGAKRSSISSIVDQFVGIESVKASIRPAWKRSFPDRADKIYVDIE